MLRSIATVAVSALLAVAIMAAFKHNDRLDHFSPAERADLDKLVHDYIVKNPKVLTEGMEALQAQETRDQSEKQRTAVLENDKALKEPPEGTIIGNAAGDLTLVEFFDYNCPYCKAIFPALIDAVNADGKVRLVLKEYPFLGPGSITASRAALAAVKQGKYSEFHVALINHKGSLTDAVVMQVAKDVGLDVARLQTDMKSTDIDKTIDANHELAQKLGIDATPSLILGDTVVPYVFETVQKGELKGLLAKARTKP